MKILSIVSFITLTGVFVVAAEADGVASDMALSERVYSHPNNLLRQDPGLLALVNGDVNSDGLFNMADFKAWETALEVDQPVEGPIGHFTYKEHLDVNCDGEVTPLDGMLILSELSWQAVEAGEPFYWKGKFITRALTPIFTDGKRVTLVSEGFELTSSHADPPPQNGLLLVDPSEGNVLRPDDVDLTAEAEDAPLSAVGNISPKAGEDDLDCVICDPGGIDECWMSKWTKLTPITDVWYTTTTCSGWTVFTTHSLTLVPGVQVQEPHIMGCRVKESVSIGYEHQRSIATTLSSSVKTTVEGYVAGLETNMTWSASASQTSTRTLTITLESDPFYDQRSWVRIFKYDVTYRQSVDQDYTGSDDPADPCPAPFQSTENDTLYTSGSETLAKKCVTCPRCCDTPMP